MFELIDKLKKANLLNTVLVIVTIVLEVIGLLLMLGPSSDFILDILNIVALLCGLYYIATGYKKSSANFYKIFMYLYAFEAIYATLSCIITCSNDVNAFVFILEILFNVFHVLLVSCLAFIKNLGKKASIRLAEINVICAIASVILFGIIIVKDISLFLDLYLGSILVAILALVFVIAKYENKGNRGAK